jgi:alkylhydroperoxidase family enzyme
MPTSQNRLNRYDVKAREAQVVGSGPRIDAIPDADIPEPLRATVNDTRASIGLGPATPLPEYTRLIARNPVTFQPYMEMGTANFSGPIPPQERELAVLRTAWICGAPYEWGEHVHIAKRYGVAQQAIDRVSQGCTASGWTPHEAAILCGVDELVLDQALHDDTYARLALKWSEQQMIAFLMMVGSYVATAMVQNSLRARLATDNPGLTAR